MRKIEDFDEAYEIIANSFPTSELLPYEKIQKLFQSGHIRIYGYYEVDLKGVMIIRELDDIVFIENFAVDETARGEGLGSKMLDFICAEYKDWHIVLEVEEPHDEMSERRVNFYERNGFILSSVSYMQPLINTERNHIPLHLMVYREMVEASKLEEIKELVFKDVYRVNR